MHGPVSVISQTVALPLVITTTTRILMRETYAKNPGITVRQSVSILHGEKIDG